jgi:plasmid stabilization system protein ParE
VKAVRILPEAEEELAEAAAWYEARRAGLGVDRIAFVDHAFEEIADAPLACELWHEDRPYRRKIPTRFPYVIFFRVDANTVVIMAVAHSKRRPGYWADRSGREDRS